MNFPKFQRLVEDRTGFRTMENATASGEYFSDSCGDMYNFFLKIGPGAVIEDISYFTTGCGFGTATCSLVVDLAKGKTIDEAAVDRCRRHRERARRLPGEEERLSAARARSAARRARRLQSRKLRQARFRTTARCRLRNTKPNRLRKPHRPNRRKPKTVNY